jgi:hypothetical protein
MSPEIQEQVAPFPTRLDERSKISLMAAVIYGTSEVQNVRSAVDAALEIDRLVGDKIRDRKYRRNGRPLIPNFTRTK